MSADKLSPATLARLEQLFSEHVVDPWMNGDVCTCGVVFDRSYAAHVVQELAAAGLLEALARPTGAGS